MDKVKINFVELCAYQHLHEKWLSDATLLVMMQTTKHMPDLSKKYMNRAISSLVISGIKYVDCHQNDVQLHLFNNIKRIYINGRDLRIYFYFITIHSNIPKHFETQDEWVKSYYFNPTQTRSSHTLEQATPDKHIFHPSPS